MSSCPVGLSKEHSHLTLHSSLGIDHIHTYIHRLATSFYEQCKHNPNPLICDIGSYTLQDLHEMYGCYKHKRIRHVLL
jgi:hypothetical protein